MSIEISVDEHDFTIDVSGIHLLICLSRQIRIRLADITACRVVTQSEAKGDLGWRVGGGYIPGRLATGWFTMPGRKGARQWWAVFRATEVVLIDTVLDRPGRVVLQHDHPEFLVAEIERRRATAS